MDAKVATADMASRMMVWAEIGRPNQTEWVPREGGRARNSYARNDGLYPAGYYLFNAQPSDALRTAVQANEQARLQTPTKPEGSAEARPEGRGAGRAGGRGGAGQ